MMTDRHPLDGQRPGDSLPEKLRKLATDLEPKKPGIPYQQVNGLIRQAADALDSLKAQLEQSRTEALEYRVKCQELREQLKAAQEECYRKNCVQLSEERDLWKTKYENTKSNT